MSNNLAARFLQDPGMQSMYKDWTNLPCTKLVREILDELCQLQSLSPVTPENGLYRYGFAEGSQLVRDFLFDMLSRLQAAQQLRDANNIPADYGADITTKPDTDNKKGDK